jgi:hypothetical protein
MVTFRPFVRRNSLFSDFRSLLSKFFLPVNLSRELREK